MRFVRLWAERAQQSSSRLKPTKRSCGHEVWRTHCRNASSRARDCYSLVVTSITPASGSALKLQIGVSVTALTYAGVLWLWASKNHERLDAMGELCPGRHPDKRRAGVLSHRRRPVRDAEQQSPLRGLLLRHRQFRAALTTGGSAPSLWPSLRVQFLGLLGYAASHWDLSTCRGRAIAFTPVRHSLCGLSYWQQPGPARLLLLAGRGTCG